MLLSQSKSVQCGQASRASSVFDAQLASDTSQEPGGTSLHRQRATQKEQASGLHCLDVGAKWGWRIRQTYAKVLQPLLRTSVRFVGGHYYHLPICAPPSTCSTSPVTW